jgi:hypothetical protein
MHPTKRGPERRALSFSYLMFSFNVDPAEVS